MNKILKILGLIAEDIFIILGLLIIILTTYRLNVIAGSYLLGVVLLAFGVILSKKPPKT